MTGNAFLAHHLDYMLGRYEAWRSKYFLPPLRPWDGQSAMDGEQSASVPGRRAAARLRPRRWERASGSTTTRRTEAA